MGSLLFDFFAVRCIGVKMNNLYKILSHKKYNEKFGINPKNNDLHKKAFKKAWEIRNFEIDKFWQRSLYFWGFISLIFTGYIIIITSDTKDIVEKMHIDLYMILLGCIFSVGWFLVIRGSKRWQDNWEEHIDKLEDKITGPLYKTIYYKGKKFYSVSKINEILALVVIAVWLLLFARYIYDNYKFFCNAFKCFSQNTEFYIFVLLPIIAAIGCIIILFSRPAQTDGGEVEAESPNTFLIKIPHG